MYHDHIHCNRLFTISDVKSARYLLAVHFIYLLTYLFIYLLIYLFIIVVVYLFNVFIYLPMLNLHGLL